MPKRQSSVPRWHRALITGASAGIGEAFARELAAEGTALVLVARRTAQLETIANEFRAAGVEVEILAADLSDRTQLELVADRVRNESKRVDLLVNNAGISVWGRFDQQPIDRHEKLLAVLVTAPMILTHAAAAAMAARGSGTIVNVSSLTGNGPVPDLASYCGAKAFINNFSQAVSRELRRSGVVVTTVLPGPTRTSINDLAGHPIDTSGREWMAPQVVVRQALDAAAKGRRHAIPGRRNQIETLFTPRFPNGFGGFFLRLVWSPMVLYRRRKERRAART